MALVLPLPLAAAQTAAPACGDEVVSLAGAASATAAHGAALAAWRFVPGAGAEPGVPAQDASGTGWASDPLDGIVPAGPWCLTAEVATDARGDLADGTVLAAVYARGADGDRLLGVATSPDVLAGATTTVALAIPLGAVPLHDEQLLVEWYLTVARHQVRGATGYDAAAVTTTLTPGPVTLPGPLGEHPLVGPTRARVEDPQDHRLTLAWEASDDPRIERYVVRAATSRAGPYSDLATVDGTTFVVDGLPNRTPAFFQVVGSTAPDVDGVRRETGPSNVTQGRPIDRTPPDAPGAPTVAPVGSGVLRVTWPAGVAGDLAGYRLERAAAADGRFEVVGTDLVERTYDDVALPPQSRWWYRVRTVDDDGLVSDPGPATAATTAPAIVTGLYLAAVGDGVLTIGWHGTSRPLAGYRIERSVAGGPYASVGGLVTGTSFTDGGLANGTVYRYRVLAEDVTGVRSSPSDALAASPRATPGPLPPTSLVVSDASRGALLEWGASPSGGVVGYQILRAVDGGAATDLGGVRTGRSHTDRDVVPGRRYEYTVVAVDAAGRRSPPTHAVTFVVQPAAPTGLQATPAGTSTVALTWTPSGEPGVRYEVWRSEGTGAPQLIARTDASRLDDTGLLLETRYGYFVRAVAAGFRASPASNTVEVTLRDGPPSAPVATAVDTTEGGAIEVRWRPPDEADVAAWRVERRIAGDARWDVVTDVPQPLRSHVDRGLTDGVRYEYRLFALDRGGAESPPSAITSAVPSDTTPPPSPAAPSVRLTVGALAVDWEVAPGAVRYEVTRATSPTGPFTLIATTSLRTIRDADVAPGTTYHYRVVAIDAVGNASAPSPTGTGTFTTTVSPGSVLPMAPPGSGGPVGGPGGGGGAAGPLAPPASPFDPSRPLFPGIGVRPTDGSAGGGTAAPPLAGTRPDDDRPVLAFPPDLSELRDAVSAGDLPGAVGRVIGEVAGNVPDVARTFSVPLLLVVVILLYLMAQGRIDRDAAVLTVEAPAGGDDDDVEFLL